MSLALLPNTPAYGAQETSLPTNPILAIAKQLEQSTRTLVDSIGPMTGASSLSVTTRVSKLVDEMMPKLVEDVNKLQLLAKAEHEALEQRKLASEEGMERDVAALKASIVSLRERRDELRKQLQNGRGDEAVARELAVFETSYQAAYASYLVEAKGTIQETTALFDAKAAMSQTLVGSVSKRIDQVVQAITVLRGVAQEGDLSEERRDQHIATQNSNAQQKYLDRAKSAVDTLGQLTTGLLEKMWHHERETFALETARGTAQGDLQLKTLQYEADKASRERQDLLALRALEMKSEDDKEKLRLAEEAQVAQIASQERQDKLLRLTTVADNMTKKRDADRKDGDAAHARLIAEEELRLKEAAQRINAAFQQGQLDVQREQIEATVAIESGKQRTQRTIAGEEQETARLGLELKHGLEAHRIEASERQHTRETVAGIYTAELSSRSAPAIAGGQLPALTQGLALPRWDLSERAPVAARIENHVSSQNHEKASSKQPSLTVPAIEEIKDEL